ncbi:hypothetical protein EJB05_24289, partial [Eragrostis curvula]
MLPGNRSSSKPIFGREKELVEVIRLLGVPINSSRPSSKRKRNSNSANNEPRITSVPVLPIVGMGGVGKTTLAQEITTLKRVKSYFDKIIWICVSDDFDVEKLTKAIADNFDDLQQDLLAEVGKKRFLLILDDIWPDVLKEDVFWDFFKLCVSGSENSNIEPQLEMIGRSIIPKLKGSPLAAKTIGRLLRKSINADHWNDILNSELWHLPQKETDILPALRLSYMYLPFHLKRCFSFCAVYPKDYNFQKASLVEIWIAEGFVEPQGNIPLQHTGDLYFEELVNLSFQKHRGKHNKLRTLLCHKYLRDRALASVMVHWFSELGRLRVIFCASMREVPKNISNLKHLRYLEISKYCPLRSLPSSFCCLYNLQILYARKCTFESLPSGFSKLINLQKFEAQRSCSGNIYYEDGISE